MMYSKHAVYVFLFFFKVLVDGVISMTNTIILFFAIGTWLMSSFERIPLSWWMQGCNVVLMLGFVHSVKASRPHTFPRRPVKDSDHHGRKPGSCLEVLAHFHVVVCRWPMIATLGGAGRLLWLPSRHIKLEQVKQIEPMLTTTWLILHIIVRHDHIKKGFITSRVYHNITHESPWESMAIHGNP